MVFENPKFFHILCEAKVALRKIELFTIELLHKPDHASRCANVLHSLDTASSPCVQSRLQKYAANLHLTRTSANFVVILFAAEATIDCGVDFMID